MTEPKIALMEPEVKAPPPSSSHCQCHDPEHTDGCACGHEQAAHAHCGGDCACGHDHHETHAHCGDECGCGHDHEHTASAPLSAPAAWAGGLLLALSFVPLWPGVWSNALAVAGTLLVGYPLFAQGIGGIVRLRFDELSLMTIAAWAAVALGETYEAAMVTVLFRVGSELEARAVSKSRREIESLSAIRPDTARVITPSGDAVKPAKDVPVGAAILIRPGERVPLDCIVSEGSANMDTSALTGEALPRQVAAGDKLLSGMINSDGVLRCVTVSSFADSAATRIIKMVEEAREKKGRTETLIARFARVYTPVVILLAALLAFGPPLLFSQSLRVWLPRALVFLVASCPCALVISIPLTFYAGVGASSRLGVLVKGSRYLEALAAADCVILDKTGTLTLGIPRVEALIPAEGFSRKEVMRLAGIAEGYSNHPLARAVLAFTGTQDLSVASGYTETPGMGVRLYAGKSEVLCGSASLMEQSGIDIASLPPAGVYVALDGRAAGCITFTDTLRPDAPSGVSALKALGLEPVMLSGDGAKAARKVGEACGIDTVHGDLLPEGKVRLLQKYKAARRATLFVGDGINDAPVLAAADVGAAMGMGTEAAIEAGDLVVMSERIGALADVIGLARLTVAKARFNIAFALGVKVTVLVLGALGLAGMWMAVFADVGVSIISVLNAVSVLRASARFRASS